MENLLLIIISILLFIILVLCMKIYFLRKAAKEIIESLHEKLTADSNTLIDISSRNSYMQKLASELNDELRLLRNERHRYQQGDLELKEAVTNISHDLRTPLTALNGYLGLLEKEEKTEAVTLYLSHIQNRTDALKNLTEELFCYSIVSSHDLKPERIDLVRALEESLLSFYALMQEKDIQPHITLPKQSVWFDLDKSSVNRIFSNIISNALKYSDDDFSVVMENAGCITFSNTAPKLDAISVGKLFDRFYTVEANRNSTGLGLSIAKILTEQMNGTIEANYTNGRLYITLIFEH